jgi:hypothetical protein
MKFFLLIFSLVSFHNFKQGSKENTKGQMIFAFSNVTNGVVKTILPINGGDINSDSLKSANTIQVFYREGKTSQRVKDIRYKLKVIPDAMDGLELDSLMGFDIHPAVSNWYRKKNEIVIRVYYIILETNDTIFNPKTTKENISETNRESNIVFRLK